MSDFWRGNPLGQTQFGDSINFQPHAPATPLSTINVAAAPTPTPQKQLTRYLTQMSQQEEEEMSEAFTAHNRRL